MKTNLTKVGKLNNVTALSKKIHKDTNSKHTTVHIRVQSFAKIKATLRQIFYIYIYLLKKHTK